MLLLFLLLCPVVGTALFINPVRAAWMWYSVSFVWWSVPRAIWIGRVHDMRFSCVEDEGSDNVARHTGHDWTSKFQLYTRNRQTDDWYTLARNTELRTHMTEKNRSVCFRLAP